MCWPLTQCHGPASLNTTSHKRYRLDLSLLTTCRHTTTGINRCQRRSHAVWLWLNALPVGEIYAETTKNEKICSIWSAATRDWFPDPRRGCYAYGHHIPTSLAGRSQEFTVGRRDNQGILELEVPSGSHGRALLGAKPHSNPHSRRDSSSFAFPSTFQSKVPFLPITIPHVINRNIKRDMHTIQQQYFRHASW